MSITCELRQVTPEEAASYVRHPEKLIQLQQLGYEAAKNRRDSGEYSVSYPIQSRYYTWQVLLALVSPNEQAFYLLTTAGKSVGGIEESWLLDAEVRALSTAEILLLNDALRNISVDDEEGLRVNGVHLTEDLQEFVRQTVDQNKTLLIFVGP